MIKIGTPEGIGEANRKIILNHLRLKGDMSRADLTRETTLSFPAVSSNIRHLLEKGYIHETGAGDNSVGRKSKLLSFNAKRGLVIGIDIGRQEIRYMLADLLGSGIATMVRGNKPEDSGPRIIKDIVNSTKRLIRDNGVDAGNILAICVGIPGIIRGDRMFAAPYMSDFSLKKLREALEREFATDVTVENSVNLGAIGERWRGIGVRYSDFVYVGYGVGLGSALILGGRLYKGVNGAAGEIGFMTVDPRLLRTRFNEIGVLESLISKKRIAEALRADQDAAAGTDFDALFRQSGGRRAARLIEEVSQFFGMALVNIAAMVNPQAIVVSGGVGRVMGERLASEWEEMLERLLPFPPDIVFSRMSGREPLLGAVYTALERVYNAPIA